MTETRLDPSEETAQSAVDALFDAVRDLSSTLSSREVLSRLMHRALSHLGATRASVLIRDEAGLLRVAASRGLATEVAESCVVAPGEGVAGTVFESGRAILVRDIACDARFAWANRATYSTPSFVSAPIAVDGEVRGVVNVGDKVARAPFAASDLALLQALAGQAAVAARNAERYEELLVRAQRDALTGLSNRGHLWSNIQTEVARAARYERAVSLVMIDVDDFKGVNDRHGHVAGDETLAGVAEVISQLCRSSDVAGRYGGEEFAVVLPETSLEGATVLAEKIRGAVEVAYFGSEPVTVSLGVAAFPVHAQSAPELVAAADRQLYRAKAEGKNCVCSPVEGSA